MSELNDHFKQTLQGLRYAGDHLLVEFWDAENLTEPEPIRHALEAAASAAGATLIHSHYHQFGLNEGVSGVSVLAESHLSIHTWPERSYAAIDIFMCGECDPRDCLAELERHFRPKRIETQIIQRGLLAAEDSRQDVA